MLGASNRQKFVNHSSRELQTQPQRCPIDKNFRFFKVVLRDPCNLRVLACVSLSLFVFMSLIMGFVSSAQSAVPPCQDGAYTIGTTACLIRWFAPPTNSSYLPVLLVHGINTDNSCESRGGGAGTWKETTTLLRQAGVDVWEFEYITGDLLDTSADLLKQALGEMAQHIEQNSINIIAHSQGGLVVRFFLQYPLLYPASSPLRVNKLMTFGTPHQGVTRACVDAAVVGLNCINAAQFDEQGSWINQLNNGWSLPDLESDGIDYFFVAGDTGLAGQLNLGGILCAGGEPCDGIIKITSALGPSATSMAGGSINNRVAKYVIPGLWHAPISAPNPLASIGPWLVYVTGPDHPGYRLMHAFATDQLNGQLSNKVLLSVTAAPDPVKPGELITYSYTVTNRGGTDLSGLELSTLVPDHTHVDSKTITDGGGCSGALGCNAGTEILWSLGALAAGQNRMVGMAAKVDSSFDIAGAPPDGTVIFNSARVVDGVENEASDTVFTRVCAGGGIALRQCCTSVYFDQQLCAQRGKLGNQDLQFSSQPIVCEHSNRHGFLLNGEWLGDGG
jgi:uncharacterized repeat protein (TIGR01451 family)